MIASCVGSPPVQRGDPADDQPVLHLKNASAQTVFIRNTNAAFNGNKHQALEYYNGFTTYGWKDTDAYIFQLFVYVPED